MTSSKTHSTVVSYVLATGTKGTITVATADLLEAVETVKRDLFASNIEDEEVVAAAKAKGALDLFTITKAVVEDQPLPIYAGFRSSL